ncbi:ABC transporter substrate binding protein, partial [Bacillus subtilis]
MKRLIATIIALAVFLGVAFNVEKKQEESKNKMPIVAILQTLSHPALDQIHQGIVDGLKEEGFVNGKTMKIDYQNAQGDQSNL